MIYAIGDIHGQLAMLQAAHSRIAQDQGGEAHAPVIHLGDLTDRGPQSREVIDYLMDGIARGAPWHVIKGNHDRMFCYFMREPSQADHILRPDLTWLHPRLGGQTTLNSYGVETDGRSPEQIHDDALRAVPKAHLEFLETLPLSHGTDDLMFVHAGVNPEVGLDAQLEDDLLWIRDPFLLDPVRYDRLIVHGHTVVDAPQHHGNRVNLDTGAGYDKPLTAAVFEGRDCWILEPAGRRKLDPNPYE